MTQRNLIIIHRGPEYQQDFEDIATGVRRLDPGISIHICDIATAPLPEAVWELPTLTVAVTPSFRQEIKRGTILRNQPISKTAQYEQMQRCGIPTPPQKLFKFGMKLDPIIFGAHVILKPNGTKFQSKGHGVNVFRRAFLEGLRPKDFHPLHPIHFDSAGYLVQRFTYTGPFATTHRVTTFLGEVLFCAKYISNTPSPDLSSDDATIINGNFTQKGDRTITFESQDDILAVAKKTAQAFNHIPLMGIDIVRDANTSALYVLEFNPGGNTWHFSSKMWEERRKKSPHLAKAMRTQFNAFDVSAQVLVEKTRLLAS